MFSRAVKQLFLAGLMVSVAASALVPKNADRYVAAARSLLGVSYSFGGRMAGAHGGVDCLGLFFFAFEAVSGCGWKSYSVFPAEAVQRGEYGQPVPGLSPVSAEALDVQKLQPADIVLLLSAQPNPAEGSVAELDGVPLWVWHTGMYSGDGRWIVGDHFAGRVIEVDLKDYLRDHADTYTAVFVARLDSGPKPKACRKHAPMRRIRPER